MWKTSDEELSKSMSTDSIAAASPGGSPFPGSEAKKSSRCAPASPARCTSMKPPPPGPVSGTLGNPGREGRCDARVDGVAALCQHPGSRLGGQRVPGRDCPSHT